MMMDWRATGLTLLVGAVRRATADKLDMLQCRQKGNIYIEKKKKKKKELRIRINSSCA